VVSVISLLSFAQVYPQRVYIAKEAPVSESQPAGVDMITRRRAIWIGIVALIAAVLAGAFAAVALTRGSSDWPGGDYRYGPGMMHGDHGGYGPGMMFGDHASS
jgi:hypothetical protein